MGVEERESPLRLWRTERGYAVPSGEARCVAWRGVTWLDVAWRGGLSDSTCCLPHASTNHPTHTHTYPKPRTHPAADRRRQEPERPTASEQRRIPPTHRAPAKWAAVSMVREQPQCPPRSPSQRQGVGPRVVPAPPLIPESAARQWHSTAHISSCSGTILSCPGMASL